MAFSKAALHDRSRAAAAHRRSASLSLVVACADAGCVGASSSAAKRMNGARIMVYLSVYEECRP
jgi:hypothetical protein